MNKYDMYKMVRKVLTDNKVHTELFSEIPYGIQFKVSVNGMESTVRIYESTKKGVTVDTSQVKSSTVMNLLSSLSSKDVCSKDKNKKNKQYQSDSDDVDLIGIDESGKGDFFGPLCVAGVYATKRDKEELKRIGVKDSKDLSDDKISELAEKIKKICDYTISITVHNEDYNNEYKEFENLNKLLSHYHSKAIIYLSNKSGCKLALSDKFNYSDKMLEELVHEIDDSIVMEQKCKGESNIVVAAASILARDAYVKACDRLIKDYGIPFNKGCSHITKKVAKQFIDKYGRDELYKVCKTHFKTYREI